MSDQTAPKAASKPTMENTSFQEVLRALVGKTVTIVNSESYESAPMGHQLRTGFYRAKVAGLGQDFMILLTEFADRGKDAEPVKQYIPLSGIKRISMMKSERLLHI